MTMFFRYVAFVLITVSINTYSQVYESIETTAAEYFISLSNNDSKADDDLFNLKEILFNDYDQIEFESKYQISIKEFESLKNHFNKYESIMKNISKDSALVLFNQWYLHFSNTFYNYADEKFFSSNKVKLLLFSASVSCACTLEMCRNQTVDFMKFAKENGYDYWIIDSYENNQLQIEYETLFTPSALMFDENDKVLSKIEYDEKMITKLSEFLVNHHNKKLRG